MRPDGGRGIFARGLRGFARVPADFAAGVRRQRGDQTPRSPDRYGPGSSLCVPAWAYISQRAA